MGDIYIPICHVALSITLSWTRSLTWPEASPKQPTWLAHLNLNTYHIPLLQPCWLLLPIMGKPLLQGLCTYWSKELLGIRHPSISTRHTLASLGFCTKAPSFQRAFPSLIRLLFFAWDRVLLCNRGWPGITTWLRMASNFNRLPMYDSYSCIPQMSFLMQFLGQL